MTKLINIFKVLYISSVFLIIPSSYAMKAKENLLILEEIQKSIIKDFNIKNEVKVVKYIPHTKKTNKIEELLKRNRELIKKRRMKEKKKSLQKSDDWMTSRLNQQDQWMNTKKKQISTWEDEKKKTIAKWMAERQKFLKKIPQYKKALFEFPKIKLSASQKIKKKIFMTKEVKIPNLSEYHIIKSAFDLPVKDQGKRPTCASFAGVRAVEILLARKESPKYLSEQYFYWASKPKCQRSPCSKRGSWVQTAYRKSMSSLRPDIPLQDNCKYNMSPLNGNETQTPLKSGCNTGKVKIQKFSEAYTTNEIITAIKLNRPIIGGFKLSPSFYKNNGYVFVSNDKNSNKKLDSHAAGHAILIVGHMKLPKSLHKTEGRFCLIAANSWGIGWGKGGHSCLSEKWIKKYRFDIPFISLDSIQI